MHNKKNSILAALRDGRDAYGLFVQFPMPQMVEAIGYQGYDFIALDMEHGHFGFDQLSSLIIAADAADVTPLVRVPDHEDSTILKTMDMGPMGIIVPNINTAEDAQNAVRAGKYSPLGTRGACPWVRAAEYNSKDWQEHLDWTSRETMVILTIESKDGVDHIDEILQVPGIDGIMIGALDMAQSLGIPGQIAHEEVTSRIEFVSRKVTDKGLPLVGAVFADLPHLSEAVQTWKRRGSHTMILGCDKGLLCDCAHAYYTQAVQTK